MKSKKTVSWRFTRKNARILIRALLLGFVVLNRQAKAQYVLAPTPQPPDPTPPAMQQANEMDVFATPPQTEAEPLKWGALTLRPHPFYQFLYADGHPVQHQPGCQYHHPDHLPGRPPPNRQSLDPGLLALVDDLFQ